MKFFESYFKDVDFDNIKKRDIPEKDWAACGHGGKRKKNILTSLFLNPEELENSVLARYEKYKKIRDCCRV